DIPPTSNPRDVGPFIMNPEGQSRLFCRGMMRDGPFPAHFEPFESPVVNVVAPAVRGNPVARVVASHADTLGDAGEFPYAATSYRRTGHFHSWITHVWVNSVCQPECFVEISAELAAERSIAKGGWCRVWNKRGSVVAEAVVTKRIQPLICDGKPVH